MPIVHLVFPKLAVAQTQTSPDTYHCETQQQFQFELPISLFNPTIARALNQLAHVQHRFKITYGIVAYSTEINSKGSLWRQPSSTRKCTMRCCPL